MATELEGRRVPVATGLSPTDLADFVETTTIGLHSVGPDGTILWANRADHELLGYAREEYVGRNITEFHADRANVADMLATLQRGERLVARRATLLHKDGSLRHVLIDSSGYFRDGKFERTRCFTRDVTALTEQTRLNDTLLRAQDELGDGLILSEGGRIEWVNDAFCRLLGFQREEVLSAGFDLARRSSPGDRNVETVRILQRRDDALLPHRYEADLVRKDGTIVACDISEKTFALGASVKWLCIVRDISARRADERTQRERDAFLTRATLALLEASLDPDETMRLVARFAVESLADAANVDILDGEAGLRRIVIAHRDPAKQILAEELRTRFPPHPAVRHLIAAIPRGEVRIANDFDETTIARFVSDPEELRLALQIGYRHSLIAPLWGRGGLIGSLTLTRSGGAPYREEDAFVAKGLAARAALAYENAALHRAARDAEERLRAIFENAPVQILTIDPEGRIEAVNRSVSGRTISAIIGTNVYDTVPLADRDRVSGYILGALERGESHDYEIEVDFGSGPVWRQVRVAPRRNGGKITGAVILSTDVTDRKRAEAALAQSEERFRTLVTATTNMVWSTDAAGMIVDMPEWRAFTGQSVQEVAGAGWLDAVHPEDRERVTATWTQAYEARSPYEAEYRVRGRDGAYRTFLARAIPRVAPDGRLIEYIGTWTDVTAQRRAMHEAEVLRVQLVQGEKLAALGSLVSGVAHEIRTPLTYLANNLFLIERATRRNLQTERAEDGRVLAEFERRMQDAHESIERIDRIVGDLRKFTRLKSTGEASATSLDVAIRDAVDLYRATHRGESLIDADLRPTPLASVDRVQIQQVVLNLLQNAGEARSRGGSIRIRTYATDAGEPAIEVSDDGEGIPPDVSVRMWDPFFTTKPEGTGLGLSIVKRIVDAHGATITCESRVGEGTTFRVVFPQAARKP